MKTAQRIYEVRAVYRNYYEQVALILWIRWPFAERIL